MHFANVESLAPAQIADLPIRANGERLGVRPNLYEDGRAALKPASHDAFAGSQANEFRAGLELLLERPGNLIAVTVIHGRAFVECHRLD